MSKLSFTIPETADMTSVSRAVLYREIAAGRLKTFTVGRRRYVSIDALREYIAEREAEATAPVGRAN